MRGLLYSAKEWLQKSPSIYKFVYNAMTSNKDYRAQLKDKKQYASRFGGMWTDRTDFYEKLSVKARDQHLPKEDIERLVKWRNDGYVILPSAIPHDLIDRYMDDVTRFMQQEPSPLLMTSYDVEKPVHYTLENAQTYGSARIVDDYFFSKHSRELLFHPEIVRFLTLAFEQNPVLTQTLRFDYGSEQPLHQDTAFVRMNSPMKLIGVWIALEDIVLGSGELLYVPGSHNFKDYLFSNRFKHFDEARDGQQDLSDWHQWILDETELLGMEPQRFLAKKGDVLFWHADLAHGGAPRVKHDKTRLSLVGHFCPQGVRPLYHYYKPEKRRFYEHHGLQYSSSYYD